MRPARPPFLDSAASPPIPAPATGSPERRGVVLILVLALLSLMALIGVTFATISGQYQRSSRSFAQSLLNPPATDLVDYALNQLINDTGNPLSAIRGHSIKRDMYGNDAQYNGFLDRHPINRGPLRITAVANNGDGTLTLTTNLESIAAASLNLNFNRWILRTVPNPGEVTQTLEVNDVQWNPALATRVTNEPFVRLQVAPRVVVADNGAALAQPVVGRVFTLDGRYLNMMNGPGLDSLTPTLGALNSRIPNPTNVSNPLLGQDSAPVEDPVINGLVPGIAFPETAGRHPNFRFNGLGKRILTALAAPKFMWFNPRPLFNALGDPDFVAFGALGDPDFVGMDEDYDACDLENWFMAIQSADGRVVVPSFHRPAILVHAANNPSAPINPGNPFLRRSDWESYTDAELALMALNDPRRYQAMQIRSKFLRPRKADHPKWSWTENPTGTDPVPDPATGAIEYDVDNDGDGYKEGVWLDLGYPAERDPETGRLFKPLFSFTVIGLNGRLPLNTAGNLQARKLFNDSSPGIPVGAPLWTHTSHLGYSVNEINPLFALQNAYLFPGIPTDATRLGLDADGNPTIMNNNVYSQVDVRGINVAVTQLRNLLTGTRPHANPAAPDFTENGESDFVQVAGQPFFMPNNIFQNPGDANAIRRTPAVAGRWGEADAVPDNLVLGVDPTAPYTAFNTTVRAGRGNTGNPVNRFHPGTDDDFNGHDPVPFNAPETANLYDVAGQLPIPAERMREFSRPVDVSGNGRVVHHDWNGYLRVGADGINPIRKFAPQLAWGTGADQYGRVGHFMYFRPEGLVVDSAGALKGANTNRMHGFEAWKSPNGLNDVPNIAGQTRAYGAIDVNNNQTTEFDIDLFPRRFMAAMPFDGALNAPHNNGVPTYNPVNFAARPNPGAPVAPVNAYPLGSLAKDEASELNLYDPAPYYDAPFTNNDLDWLYNRDKDIVQQGSRLASLAPISFTNPKDGQQRRRLFAVETWDLNRASFAPSNPGNAFEFNSWFNHAAAGNTNAANPRAAWQAVVQSMQANGGFGNAIAAPASAHNGLTPPTLHGGRRINLNFAFPVSDNPFEPVRQQWVLDAYDMMKKALPPLAVDDPVERAQLFQLALNIVDFRDPDGVTTIATCPDVTLVPATQDEPARVEFRVGALASAPPLQMFGMEYQPVAINEVLAFQYTPQSGQPQARLFIELVNTLTRPGPDSPFPSANDLTLEGWDLILTKDGDELDPTTNFWQARPDPITGQPGVIPPNGVTPIPPGDPIPALEGTSGGAARANPIYYFTLSNTPADPNVEENPPPSNDTARALPTGRQLDNAWVDANLLNNPAPLGNQDRRFHWVYLRRPANPLLPPNPATNPMVVIDSMRFPYIEGSGTGAPNPNSNARLVYSVYRRQPYRGGQVIFNHNLPDVIDSGGNLVHNPAVPRPRYAYGFSEQTASYSVQQENSVPSTSNRRYRIFWDASQPPTGPGSENRYRTRTIYNTIARSNDRNDNGHFAPFTFHDREYMSVAEVLLVPICSPGLFTKQFIERSYHPGRYRNTPGDPTANDYRQRPAAYGNDPGESQRIDASNRDLSHENSEDMPSYPCLSDLFYYSGATPQPPGGQVASLITPKSWYNPADPNLAALPPSQVGGTTGAGWARMLEFFEVPSTMAGTLGPAAAGDNFDWARQDRVPGKLNPNLIIDEEVFLGLIDDPRLNLSPVPLGQGLHVVHGLNEVGAPYFQEYNRGAPRVGRSVPGGSALQVENDARINNPAGLPLPPDNGMSPLALMSTAFHDFLSLTHGGSGHIFAHGTGPVGAGNVGTPNPVPIAAERPYRSLAYPDINATIMRPAWLPPGPASESVAPLYVASGVGSTDPNWPYREPFPAPTPLIPDDPLRSFATFADQGVRNPYLEWGAWPNTLPQERTVPPLPPRRLWQMPDYFDVQFNSVQDPNNPGDPMARVTIVRPPLEQYYHPTNERGGLHVNLPMDHKLPDVLPAVGSGYNIRNRFANLFGSRPAIGDALNPTTRLDASGIQGSDPANPPAVLYLYRDRYGFNSGFRYPVEPPQYFLGGAFIETYRYDLMNDPGRTNPIDAHYNGDDPAYVGQPQPYEYLTGTSTRVTDHRREPYFRTELLQKVMNQTTPRTHQYAVWVTVAFFEVTEQGDPRLLKPDQLGPERVLPNGETERIKTFCVIDRTRAIGFNPAIPGDFRDLITYRRRIF